MENDSQDKWLQKETGASMPVAMLNFQISTVLDKAMSYLKVVQSFYPLSS